MIKGHEVQPGDANCAHTDFAAADVHIARIRCTLHNRPQDVAGGEAAVVLAISVQHGHREDLVVVQQLQRRDTAPSSVQLDSTICAQGRVPKQRAGTHLDCNAQRGVILQRIDVCVVGLCEAGKRLA